MRKARKVGLIPPPILGTKLDLYNICAYANLAGCNPSLILEQLNPHASRSPKEHALASFLFFRLNDTRRCYEASLRAISETPRVNSWIWNNLAMQSRWFGNELGAAEIIQDVGANYQNIFGQKKFQGGLVNDPGCADAHWKADDVLIVWPNVSLQVLNRGAVAFFGERELQIAIAKHRKTYPAQQIKDSYDGRVAWVHNGEFVIPTKALQKIASDKHIQLAQEHGRIQNRLGVNMDAKLRGRLVHPAEDPKAKMQLETIKTAYAALIEIKHG